MVSVVQFIAIILTSVVDLVRIFLFDVAFRQPFDPLALVSFLMGAVFVGASVLVVGYLALGAFGNVFSGALETPAQTPSQRE